MKLINILKRAIRGGSSATQEIELLKSRGLKIGEKVDIFSEFPFDSLYPGLISIGNNVTISSNVKILAHDASMGYINNGTVKIGIVDIGNNVFIGHGTTILCDVRIGDNSIIGAGSVVTKDVPANCVYAGNPARFIKTVEEYKISIDKKIETSPTFNIPWREIRQYDSNQFAEIREQLKNGAGFIVKK